MDDMIPAEKLAAFIDGRLDETERAEVMAVLARSEDAREILADAVSVLHPDSEGDTAAPDVRVALPRIRRLKWSAPLAAAAAIAVVTLGLLRDGGDPGADMVAAVAAAPAVLPEAWAADPGWTLMRGDPDETGPTLFRIGVRLVDLRVALAAGDQANRDRIASELANLLDRIDGGAALARPFEAIAQGVPQRESAIEDQIETALAVLDAPAIRLGHALEAARIAARIGRIGIARDEIEGAVSHADGMVGGLRGRLAELNGVAGDQLSERLSALIRELGR
jgi:hypothetical protein